MIKRRHIASATEEVLDEVFGQEDSLQVVRASKRVLYPMSWESGTRVERDTNHRKLQIRQMISVDASRRDDRDAATKRL